MGCLPRIQFTSKRLRLDRRYCELKKKEHQFNTKMSEQNKKYKKRMMALLEKEKALKLKECELNQKEVLLSSKRSLTSTTDSRASGTASPRHSIGKNNLSPSSLTIESLSVDSDKLGLGNQISPTYLHKRTTSNISTINTSSTATSSIAEEKEIEEAEMVMMNDDDNSRYCPTFNTFSLEGNDSKESNAVSSDIVDDARNFLQMKKINVNDLNDADLRHLLHCLII